jgi:hypothetical protein
VVGAVHRAAFSAGLRGLLGRTGRLDRGASGQLAATRAALPLLGPGLRVDGAGESVGAHAGGHAEPCQRRAGNGTRAGPALSRKRTPRDPRRSRRMRQPAALAPCGTLKVSGSPLISAAWSSSDVFLPEAVERETWGEAPECMRRGAGGGGRDERLDLRPRLNPELALQHVAIVAATTAYTSTARVTPQGVKTSLPPAAVAGPRRDAEGRGCDGGIRSLSAPVVTSAALPAARTRPSRLPSRIDGAGTRGSGVCRMAGVAISQSRDQRLLALTAGVWLPSGPTHVSGVTSRRGSDSIRSVLTRRSSAQSVS